MPAVASPSFVLTRRRLKNVLAKSDVTNSITDTDKDTRVDTEQVEYLLSVKKGKHDNCEMSLSQTGWCDTMQSTVETSDEHEIVEKLKFYVWIQCENPECLKWRCLPKSEAAAMDEDTPWFCFMNTDSDHNSCEDVEDDYRSFERQARQCHLKCIVSTLPIGSLVWAKMTGYCRWPGIISCDPKCGEYVEHDEDPEDPEPTYYHVEFLGMTHSHSWVLAQSVELYGLVAETKKLTSNKSRKDRASYHGGSVEAAISEANQLLDCLGHKRLETCIFRHHKKDDNSSRDDADDKACTDGRRKVNIRSCQQSRITRVEKIISQKMVLGQNHKIPSKDLTKSCQNNSRDRKKARKKGGVQTLLSRPETTQSVIGQSKEEKYVLDVQMYQQNQSAFQHDVCRFMVRSHCRIRKMPLWHGTPITLFQLFLAVHERGGYQQVCRQRDWTAVYNEVTSVHGSSSGGAVAKRYYRRNLLSYELYISGLDYPDALAQCEPKSPYRQKRRRSSTQDPGDDVDQDRGCDTQSTDSDSSGVDVELDKMKGILDEMDSIAAQCDFSYLDDAEHTEPYHSNLVTFYDESPDERLNDYRLADTASEFGLADSPGEDASPSQEFPDLGSLVSCGGGSEEEDVSVGLNVEEMLQDVAAMQREIDEFEDTLSEPC